MNEQRLKLVMKCFDKLPEHQRDWINNCEKLNLHDDHILRGEKEVARCIIEVENNNIYYKRGNNQN
jgi:hypothetical protein